MARGKWQVHTPASGFFAYASEIFVAVLTKAKQKAKDALISYSSVKDVLYLTAACPTQTFIPYVGANDLFTEVLRKDHLPLCRKSRW